MKKSKKIIIIISVIMIAMGVIISALALFSVNFDFLKLDTVSYATKTYEVEESFNSISIKDTSCDINLMISEDGNCHITCIEEEKITHNVAVQNDTLTVEISDNRKWYEHIYFFHSEQERIDLYLPEDSYEELYINIVSGDIEIPENITFDKADINTTSGDISFSAKIKDTISVNSTSGDITIGEVSADNIYIQTTSGNIALSSAKAKNEINLSSTSGNICASSAKCSNITSETTSGNVKYSDIVAANRMQAETVSGDVLLNRSDSDNICINTTSGNVSGTLLTDKIFNAYTKNGNISVPKSTAGGSCKIITISGNIDISVLSN